MDIYEYEPYIYHFTIGLLVLDCLIRIILNMNLIHYNFSKNKGFAFSYKPKISSKLLHAVSYIMASYYYPIVRIIGLPNLIERLLTGSVTDYIPFLFFYHTRININDAIIVIYFSSQFLLELTDQFGLNAATNSSIRFLDFR